MSCVETHHLGFYKSNHIIIIFHKCYFEFGSNSGIHWYVFVCKSQRWYQCFNIGPENAVFRHFHHNKGETFDMTLSCLQTIAAVKCPDNRTLNCMRSKGAFVCLLSHNYCLANCLILKKTKFNASNLLTMQNRDLKSLLDI